MDADTAKADEGSDEVYFVSVSYRGVAYEVPEPWLEKLAVGREVSHELAKVSKAILTSIVPKGHYYIMGCWHLSSWVVECSKGDL